MTIHFILESFDSIEKEWYHLQQKSGSNFIFFTPYWSRIWWHFFGTGYTLNLNSIRFNNEVIGIAPLMMKNDTAFLIGNTDVCDYLDFIIKPGFEDIFYNTLLNHLIDSDIKNINLTPLRTDSSALKYLVPIAQQKGYRVQSQQEDVSIFLNLPSSWDGFFLLLSRKQRHELKRKIRRISEIGDIEYETKLTAEKTDIDTFLDLFKNSRKDKDEFLTSQRELFFRSIFSEMSHLGFFNLNFLKLNDQIIAATICFDYENKIYLYNSGFKREYDWLSVGLISKALSIKDSIEKNKRIYDFLKGNEQYKYHLGGQELAIYSCSIAINK